MLYVQFGHVLHSSDGTSHRHESWPSAVLNLTVMRIPCAGVRLSMPGLPRPPGAAGLSDAAVKRMSLAGPARQAATRAAGMGVGQKRQAGAMGMTGGNLAKRTKS